MQVRLFWVVYGRGTQSGALALGPLLREIGVPTLPAFSVRTVPVQVTNIRRESFSGVPDDGLTADIIAADPAVGGTATFGSMLTEGLAPAQITATLEAVRPVLAAVTTATVVEAVLSLPTALSAATLRAWSQRANRAVNEYLRANGGFLLGARGVQVRAISARAGSGLGVFLGLLGLLGLGYYITKD